MTDFYREYKRISFIKDEIERNEQQKLLDKIVKSNNTLCDLFYKYDRMKYFHKMKEKNLEFCKSDLKKHLLIKKWDCTFAKNVDPETKEQIYMVQYLWHIFSYKKKAAQEGTKAISTFNKIPKKKIYIFYQHRDEAYMINEASTIKFKHLAKEEDIYIVDELFQWTFVITHAALGPYFCKD